MLIEASASALPEVETDSLQAGKLQYGGRRSFRLFKHFLGHLITAGLMFLAAGAVSMALELAADYIEHFPTLWVIALVFHAIAYLILILDVSCLVFFLIVRAYRFVRDTWKSRGT